MATPSKRITLGSRLRALLKELPDSFLLGGLAGGCAFIVYLATIAPDITWANYSSDGGDLITAAVTLGIPHPPGYPTYVQAGKLFSMLPFGTVAFRFNLLSAVSMAVGVGFATAMAVALLADRKSARAAALAAGLSLAFSPLIWSQATVAEVYALNIMVLSIFLWALLAGRSSWLTGMMMGLAITTHLTSIMMLPLGLVLTPQAKRKQFVYGIAVGLLPLLLIPLLAQLGSPVIWGDPVTLEGWWWLVSAQLYRANIHLPHSFSFFLSRLSVWSQTILSQFAWVGWIFIILGVRSSELESHPSRWLLATAAAYAVFSFVYSPNDAILLALPALLLLLPFLALGLKRIRYWSLLLPFVLLLLHFQAQNLRTQQPLRPNVEQTLQIIPEQAIVMTPGDPSIFTLWYFQHVEGKRADLILVDENLLAFSWYRDRLAIRYPDLAGLQEDNVPLFREQNLAHRPICRLTLQSPRNFSCQGKIGSGLN